jgi:hypothetical protein
MLPPIDSAILESNPNFARLHSRLTTTLLALDASTNAKNITHVSTTETLRRHHIKVTKDEILKRGLTSLAGLKDQENEYMLPAPLRELVYTISLYISDGPAMNLNDHDHDLMAQEVEDFRANLPEISQVLSAYLQWQHDTLHNIASQAIPKQQRPLRKPPNQTLQGLISTLQPQDSSPHLQATFQTLLSLLSLQSKLLTTQITHLERHKHGTLSRHRLARAAHLSAVATALALKTRVMYLTTLKATYSGDMQSALGNYARHLNGEERKLRQREDVLKGMVEEYEGVQLGEGEGSRAATGSLSGGSVMSQLGQKYGEILKEIEDVKSDIRKLENGFGTTRANRR